jgi:site-specific DNA recombinase
VNIQSEFDRLAQDGTIGDPTGKLAYAYCRVSSAAQAVDGASGLPRQIENIHAIAKEKGYKIPWHMVRFDDHSGFDLDRPALALLREELDKARKPAYAVCFESLDRLSRETWHQDMLLAEFDENGVEAVSWQPIDDPIIRVVRGLAAKEAMKQALERMKQGTLKKAEDKRVTAKFAALGYRRVSRTDKAEEMAKETTYAIDEDRAVLIKHVYQRIAFDGYSVYELIGELDKLSQTDGRYAPPKAKNWNTHTLTEMIKNSVYKGEYIANRHYKEVVKTRDENGRKRKVTKNRERPQSEWKIVPVPPLVDEYTWTEANRRLYNKKPRRAPNKKHEYLLTSMIRCATSGHTYCGQTDKYGRQRYYCACRFASAAHKEDHPCDQKSIHCDVLDNAVWDIAREFLNNPALWVKHLESSFNAEEMQEKRRQIAYLEKEIEQKENEQDRLLKAYLAGAFDEFEFTAQKKRVEHECSELSSSLQELKSQVLLPAEIEQRKKELLDVFQHAKRITIKKAPFDLKQMIIRRLVDEIILDVNGGTFELRGRFGAGVYHLLQEYQPVHRR